MAFDFIPNSVDELDVLTTNLTISNNLNSLKKAFTYAQKQGMTNPFAFDRDKINSSAARIEIKVARNIADDSLIKNLSSMALVFKFKKGDGSRTGRSSVYNKGTKFENDIVKVLEYIQTGNPHNTPVSNHLIDKLEKLVNLNFSKESFIIDPEGSKNKRRNTVWNGKRIVVNNGQGDIGHLITDVTLRGVKSKSALYLSVKDDSRGGTTYLNGGVKQFFPKSLFMNTLSMSSIQLKNAEKAAKFLGITDMVAFISVFQKSNTTDKVVKVPVSSDLRQTLREAIGWGYWKVTPSELYDFTQKTVEKLTNVKTLEVRYPSKAKQIYGTFLGGSETFSYELRNTHGDLFPEILAIKGK